MESKPFYNQTVMSGDLREVHQSSIHHSRKCTSGTTPTWCWWFKLTLVANWNVATLSYFRDFNIIELFWKESMKLNHDVDDTSDSDRIVEKAMSSEDTCRDIETHSQIKHFMTCPLSSKGSPNTNEMQCSWSKNILIASKMLKRD